MNLGEILQRVRLELGEQGTFYPDAEIVDSGINPAQRLLCLAQPLLLQKRLALSVQPDQIVTDLRQFSRNIRRINRVVLGDVTADIPTLTQPTGQLTRLLPTHIARLASQRDWMIQQGVTKQYWLHGPYWFGLYRRPLTALTVTLIYDATPLPLTLVEPQATPDVSSVYHTYIIQIATGLLIIKEGEPEASRGITRIMAAIKEVQHHDALWRSA